MKYRVRERFFLNMKKGDIIDEKDVDPKWIEKKHVEEVSENKAQEKAKVAEERVKQAQEAITEAEEEKKKVDKAESKPAKK